MACIGLTRSTGPDRQLQADYRAAPTSSEYIRSLMISIPAFPHIHFSEKFRGEDLAARELILL